MTGFRWRDIAGRQWAVLAGATFGYGLYYVCRLSLSVVKAPLVADHVLTEAQIGLAGSALFYANAVGKFTNGVLADRLSLRKMLALGLAGSALLNLLLGATAGWLGIGLFAAVWGLNGWFQSMGAPACVVGLTRWFEPRHRGTFYGLWSAAHNIGEGLTFVLTSLVVAAWGWRGGFTASALVGAAGVLLILALFRDRPDAEVPQPAPIPGRHGLTPDQAQVLRQPLVWTIALASACMYVTRYAVNSWGIFYFHHAKGYALVEAGGLVGLSSVFGVVGTVASGWISDRFFGGDRTRPALLFGLLNAASLLLWLGVPQAHRVLDAAAMVGFGLAIGSLVCFLGGLMAVDAVPRAAAGTALGVVGIASYVGAGLQDMVSGWLIGRGRLGGGVAGYDFSRVRLFWLGAAAAGIALTLAARWLQRRPVNR